MKRWLPTPLLSATLFLVWLLLNNTIDPAHIVLAALLAIVVPRYTEKLRPDKPRLARPLVILRVGLVVLWDIVLSNIEVARRILGPEEAIKPAFVRVPLSMRDPNGILALGGMITMTPGTLTADVITDAEEPYLLVHAFNVDDEAALVATIKERYERPLMEIFP